MKDTTTAFLFVLLAAVAVTGQTYNYGPMSLVTPTSEYHGQTAGPADLTARMIAQCQVTQSAYCAWDPSVDHYVCNPQTTYTSQIDIGATNVAIGVLLPGGGRGPCRVPVTWTALGFIII